MHQREKGVGGIHGGGDVKEEKPRVWEGVGWLAAAAKSVAAAWRRKGAVAAGVAAATLRERAATKCGDGCKVQLRLGDTSLSYL